LKFKQLQKEREVELSYKSRIEDLRNQALQAQMNPHFIFNSLNAVQHYLSLNDNSKAIKFLSKFATLIRIVFEFSKKKEISLASELEMMDLYLSLEQLRFARSIEIDFIVEDEVRQKQEQILLPPLLIQPMIENSFRHGLFHKLEGGKLIIKFEVVYDFHVKCTIEDNGIGRTKTLEMASWKPKQYTSTGLYNTEERIKYWHEKNKTNITDFFKIEDLFIGNKPSGTKVTLIL
ncbi:MAG: sensor histidine kinase, partial [Saprospiraceae bacterium]